ncbi:MFS transporter [Streptomyces sp. NPDC056738]|uniref:MFS transporter n=1 Tax=Streptomyces sp. NPDC056738 TaxID=3345933 RepID=UPI0036C35325
MTTHPPVATVADTPVSPSPSPPVRRLFGMIVPLNIAIYLIIGAVPGVLLPLQVQEIDRAGKAAALALITGIGAFAAMIASPVAGLLSDRTRSRFGRRTPWIAGGSLALALSLAVMGIAKNVPQLIVAWVVVQIVLNFVISPVTALLPDRVPAARRGSFATISGVGMMIGIVSGQAAGAALSGTGQLAYAALSAVLIVAVVAFVLVCPDTPSTEQVNEPFDLKVFLRTFWVSPRRHPDFFWGFLARLALFTGYFVVTGYQLFILQDYVGLKDDAVDLVPLLGGINLVALVLTTSFSGPLSDRIGRRKPFVIASSVVMGIGMAVPFFLPTVTGMIVYTVIAGLGFGMYSAVDAALMSEVLPGESSYAKDLGVLNIAATLPQTIGPFLGGAIVTLAGYPALFPVALLLAVAGALAIIPIRSVK